MSRRRHGNGKAVKLRIIQASLLALIVVFSGFLVSEMVTGNEVKVNYQEKTLFLSNNTLTNGNYRGSNPYPSNDTPNFLYLSPFTDELYEYMGASVDEFLIVNVSTDHITGILQVPNATGGMVFDPFENLTYVSASSYFWHNGTYTNSLSLYVINNLNRVVRVIKPICGPWMYDPFNGEIYGITSVSKNNSMNYTVGVLNSSFSPIKEIYSGLLPASIAYNPVNHYVYVSNFDSSTVTVISPTDRVVANLSAGFCPDKIAVDPFNGTVYVASNGGNMVTVISASLNVTEVYFPNNVLGVYSVAYDAVDKVSLVGTGDHVEVLGSNYYALGSIPVGQTPLDIIYDLQSRSIYVQNSDSGTISIIHVTLNGLHKTEILIGLSLLLSVLIVCLVATVIRKNGHN